MNIEQFLNGYEVETCGLKKMTRSFLKELKKGDLPLFKNKRKRA